MYTQIIIIITVIITVTWWVHWWFQTAECSRRPCLCEYCELIFPAEKHAEHVEYCSSRTEPCVTCGQFVKLRDTKLHNDSNCTLPAVAAPPSSSSSNDDLVCDGMDVYHLSQLDHLLCHDVATNMLWSPSPRMNHGRAGLFGRAAPPAGRWRQSRGLFKRNHPGGQFADVREGVPAEMPRNDEFMGGRTPKVVNGPQGGNSTSVIDSDDAGKTSTYAILRHCFCVLITSSLDVLHYCQYYCRIQLLQHVTSVWAVCSSVTFVKCAPCWNHRTEWDAILLWPQIPLYYNEIKI